MSKCDCGKEKHGFASHSDWCETKKKSDDYYYTLHTGEVSPNKPDLSVLPAGLRRMVEDALAIGEE